MASVLVNTRKGVIMEKLYYELPRDSRNVPVNVLQPIDTMAVPVGASSTLINTFEDGVEVLRIVATVNCHIEFGPAPIATTSSMFMPAGVVEYFQRKPGHVIAVIQSATAGMVYISSMG